MSDILRILVKAREICVAHGVSAGEALARAKTPLGVVGGEESERLVGSEIRRGLFSVAAIDAAIATLTPDHSDSEPSVMDRFAAGAMEAADRGIRVDLHVAKFGAQVVTRHTLEGIGESVTGTSPADAVAEWLTWWEAEKARTKEPEPYTSREMEDAQTIIDPFPLAEDVRRINARAARRRAEASDGDWTSEDFREAIQNEEDDLLILRMEVGRRGLL